MKKVVLIAVGLMICGCGIYSFKGSLPAHIKTISISPVVNESSEFGISELISEKIMDILISENVLDVTGEEDADSRLNVIVKKVDDSPYTYTLPSDAVIEQVDEYRITIQATVVWYDLTRDEPLFEVSKSAWGAYGTGVDISTDKIDNDGDGLIDSEDEDEFGSPRESAIAVAIRIISEDIINEVTSTW